MKLLKLLITLLSFSTLTLAGSPKELPYLIFAKEIPKKTFAFYDGETYCEELTLYGLSDWRLPNSKELRYLTTKTIQNGKQGVKAYLEKEILDLLPSGSTPSFWSATEQSSKVVSFDYPLKDMEPLNEANISSKHQLICVYPKPFTHCYRFNKEDFNETLEKKEDLIVAMDNFFYDTVEDHRIYFAFASDSTSDFTGSSWCGKQEKKNEYFCDGVDDSGDIQLRIEKDSVYLHASSVVVSGSPDTDIDSITSKNTNFSKGVKSVCPKR